MKDSLERMKDKPLSGRRASASGVYDILNYRLLKRDNRNPFNSRSESHENCTKEPVLNGQYICKNVLNVLSHPGDTITKKHNEISPPTC